jgi:hypothetical protein
VRLAPFLCATLLSLVVSGLGSAAQEPSPALTPPAAPCRLEGETTADTGTKLFAGRDGGPVVAELGSVASHVTIDEFPDRKGTGRARIAVGTGNEHPTIRLDGWVVLARLPIYAHADIPVVAPQVAITSGERVVIWKGVSGLEADLETPRYLGVHGAPRCSDMSLEYVEPDNDFGPDDAEWMQPAGTALALFDGPGGDPIFGLVSKPGADRPSLRVVARKGGWVRLKMRDQLAIDAWAREENLIESGSGVGLGALCGGAIGMMSSSKVTTTRDAQIRLTADADGRVVGFAEQGLAFIELGREGSWVDVYPVADTIHAPSGGHWWIRASDL